MNIHKTNTGTLILNGIEYNELPLPELLVKAMAREWANNLIEHGMMRLRNLYFFRNWENEALGDRSDGVSRYFVDGRRMETDSANDIYAWCLSLPEISPVRLNLISKEGGYDCLIVIHEPETIFLRIREWFVKNQIPCLIHCGAIQYDRDFSISKMALYSKKFHYNIFQKSVSFKEDREYRLSITNPNRARFRLGEYVDITIGNCSDLISARDFPG